MQSLTFLLIAFVRYTGRHEGKGYAPIPYLWEESSPLRFRESNNFSGVIDRLLVWSSEKGKSGAKSFWSPLYFQGGCRNV